MSQLPAEELEGRLNAQRETLAFLIAGLAHIQAGAGGAEAPDVIEALEEHSRFQDHQEDPGAVPTAAFAIEGAMMREFALILETARARLSEMRKD